MATARTKTIPRTELSKLSTDPRLQRQLEAMSQAVSTDIPDSVEEALEKATDALDLAQSTQAQPFLLTGLSAVLPNGRRFVVGDGLGLEDGGSGGDFRLSLQGFVKALALLSGYGMVAKTPSGAELRTIQGGSARIEVLNGDGTTGNPSIDIDEPSLDLGNMGGTLGIAHGGTGVTQLSAFSAHNNGVSQSIPADIFTTVNFSTEVFDLGSQFAASGWTPPAGRPVVLSATVSMNMATPGVIRLTLCKNGTGINQGAAVYADGVSFQGVSVCCVDVPNGTDIYTVRVIQESIGPQSTNGASHLTWFTGSVL